MRTYNRKRELFEGSRVYYHGIRRTVYGIYTSGVSLSLIGYPGAEEDYTVPLHEIF